VDGEADAGAPGLVSLRWPIGLAAALKRRFFDVSIVRWNHHGLDRPICDSGVHHIMLTASPASMAKRLSNRNPNRSYSARIGYVPRGRRSRLHGLRYLTKVERVGDNWHGAICLEHRALRLAVPSRGLRVLPSRGGGPGR
jgi:hypothetical protein